ncbi:MAG: threonine/serine dehydratase [Chloroflexi bacterium]|nr:threonine/serine dehydratase [Chloroflexota bacterium]
MTFERPTLADVLLAKRLIAPYLKPTPLYRYGALDRLVGAEVYVKHENHQPIGAFKIRGGINLVAQLSAAERARGIITASTGNHGQSLAYAGRLFGARVIIGVPEGANPLKVEAMQNLGAEVLFHGRDFDEAREYVETLAEERNLRYVHPANEKLLIAGVATETLEILEERPDIEVIIVPVGAGSGASGACIVAKAINPQIRVIAVQAERAPAGYLSWKEGRLLEAPMNTFAEGLATRTGYPLPQSILRDLLDDFALVSDDEIRHAMRLLLEKTHNLAEGAGASALAAALKMKEQLAGKKVAIVQSGGNTSLEHLRAALAA